MAHRNKNIKKRKDGAMCTLCIQNKKLSKFVFANILAINKMFNGHNHMTSMEVQQLAPLRARVWIHGKEVQIILEN